MFELTIIGGVALALQAGAIPEVDLVCRGHGERIQMVKPDFKDKAKANSGFRRQVDPFRGAIRFRVRSGGGTAELPSGMLASPYADRNVELSKLRASADRIEDKLEIALLYAPVFRIDRITGSLTVQGSQGSFSGECEPFDPQARARF